MKKQESKLIKAELKIFGFLLILGLLAFGTDSKIVMAEAGSAYMAAATPYYKHPVTGEIEDPGNNEGIGQGMTESVLNPTALIEKTAEGKLYATVRFYLAEHISDVEFWTQDRGSADWNSVSYAIMQENLGGDYCTDYRLEIPAEDAVVKSSFFVTPMGRKVIFYMDFSELEKGSADFVVSVDDRGSSNEEGNASANLSAKSTDIPSTDIPEEDTTGTAEILQTAKGERAGARELIDAAGGLVLSDSRLLKTVQAGTIKSEGTAKETEEANAAETEGSTETADLSVTEKTAGTDGIKITETAAAAKGEKEAAVIPAVSWKLVFQCILIITIPGLLVGGTLMGVLIFLRRREERK